MAKINLEDLKYVGHEAKENSQNATVQVLEEPAVEIEEVIQSEEPTIESEEVDEVKETASENITLAVVEEVSSEIIAVRKLRIYPRPSTGVPARTFTGNVELIGQVDKFKIVKYVKPGFGVVKGYTLGL